MTMYRVGPAGIPASLKTNMDAVLNKKFGTSTTYAPATWPDNVNLLGPLPEKTASGIIASFSDGADDVPISVGWFSFVPKQAGTGTPSPSNPRAISGYTGMTISQCGKNLFNKDATPYQTGKYIISTSVIGSSDFTYTNNANYNVYRIKIEKNTSYVISSIKANAPCWGLMSIDGLVTYVYPNNGGSEGVNITLTTGATDVYLFVSIAVTGTYKCDDIVQVEKGSTATTYEAYKEKTPIVDSFGATVYGGLRDIEGTLAETHSGIVHYAGLTGWAATSTPGVFYTSNAAAYRTSGALFCDKFEVVSPRASTSLGLNCISYNTNYTSLLVNTGDATIEDFIQTMTDLGGFDLVRPLVTPTIITLSALDISTYYGANNIYTDMEAGDIEVTYRADIDMLIASLSGNRGLMMARPQLEEITEETKEEDPEVTEK